MKSLKLQAVFVVGVDGVDLRCLRHFLAKGLPPGELERLQQQLFLRVAYPLYSNAAPQTTFHMPPYLRDIVGMSLVRACNLQHLLFILYSFACCEYCFPVQRLSLQQYSCEQYNDRASVWEATISHSEHRLVIRRPFESVLLLQFLVMTAKRIDSKLAGVLRCPARQMVYSHAGIPRLPHWGSGMSLIQYLPEVAEAVQTHCVLASTSADLRWQLLRELAETKLGPALEMDTTASR